MGKWDFLYDIQKAFAFDLSIKLDTVKLTNRNTGESIDVYEEEYSSDDSENDSFIRYTVSFSTQHRHFEELDNVKQYIMQLLQDEVLPIEFFLHGKRCFGGEIKKTDYDGMTIDFLASYWGYSVDYISQLEYEIHSWSGQYNIERRRIE